MKPYVPTSVVLDELLKGAAADTVTLDWLLDNLSDFAHLHMRFPNGLRSHLFTSRLNPYRERRLTVMVTSHDMSELEQLAGRIVMIDRGRLAFDGDFSRLRREYSDRRALTLETSSEAVPALHGAEFVRSAACRHEYVFDAARTKRGRPGTCTSPIATSICSTARRRSFPAAKRARRDLRRPFRTYARASGRPFRGSASCRASAAFPERREGHHASTRRAALREFPHGHRIPVG